MKKFVAAVLLFACVAVVAANAEEGNMKRFSEHQFGGIAVTALLDAKNDGSTDILVNPGKADLDRAEEPGALATSINAFLVEMNDKIILFDTGLPQSAGGKLVDALEQVGLTPGDIDAIVITHFHFDHVGGLLDADKKAVFPKAQLYVPRVEVNKWSDPGTDFLIVYSARSNAFEYDAEIMPGITALAAKGHTPGHTVYRLEADGGKLLILGDLIHLPGLQLVNPDLAVTYDTDPAEAVKSRKRVFDAAAKEGIPVAAMHIPFPGIGVLAKEGSGYTFTEAK